MTIRPLHADDRAGWDVLWDGYLTFYETVLEPDVTDGTFARLTEERDGLFGLVAEEDGRLVGLANALAHPSTWSLEGSVYLEDLFVAPEARGRGVATALIEAVSSRAGGRKVYWQTHRDNPARSLYDRVARHDGFIVYERP